MTVQIKNHQVLEGHISKGAILIKVVHLKASPSLFLQTSAKIYYKY